MTKHAHDLEYGTYQQLSGDSEMGKCAGCGERIFRYDFGTTERYTTAWLDYDTYTTRTTA